MKYKNIANYLECNNYFNKPINELWIVDNIAIKRFEIKNLLPTNFHPKIMEVKDIIDILSSFVDLKSKKLINSFEKKLLINKIITSSEYKKEFKSISNNIDDLISCIDSISNFSSYKERYDQVVKSEYNSGTFLLKEKIELLMSLYEEECHKNDFLDTTSLSKIIFENEIPQIYSFEKIVIYGEFFYIPENLMQVLVNFAKTNSKEIVFVSSIAENLKDFFNDQNFIHFQDKLSSFLYEDKSDSIANRIKNFDSNKIELWKFSDWNDELNYIAREIKKDVLADKITLSDIAVYIPNNDLYFFKIEKIFNDYGLPITTSYADNLAQHPLGNFTKWFLMLDLSETISFLKLLKSPFTTFKYDDFKIIEDQKIIFMDKELNPNSLKKEGFNFDWFEKVLLESNIDNLDLFEDNHQKIYNYFQRKVHYEAKRGSIDNTEKIELDYLKAHIYYSYFDAKFKELKVLIPKKALIRDLKTALLNTFSFLNIEQRYINYNNEEGFYELPYVRFKETLEKICDSVEKIDNRSYEITEFINLFLEFAQSSFVSEEKNNIGIFVTELPFLSKMSFKRIYQVGMTNKHFPENSSKSIFHKFISKFKPIETRDTQLFNFTELLNNTLIKNDYELKLCYPLVLQNEEDEPSEVFLDIIPYLSEEKQRFLPKIYNHEDVIYSNTDKAQAIAKNLYIDDEINKKLLEHIEKRQAISTWSEYEGYIDEENNNVLAKSTSITKIEEYATCPMKYWFDIELGLKPSKKLTKDLDNTLKGTLIHKILEEYYTKAVKKELFKDFSGGLLSLESRNLMLEIVNSNFKTYEESLNNIYIDKIKELVISGLDNIETEKKGILLQILQLDQDRINKGISPSKFEYNFNCEIEGLKFNGIIDRVDEYSDSKSFDVLDYKTGSINKNEKSNDINEGLSFQLPIYAIAYNQETKKDLKEGLYYSLKQNSFKYPISLEATLTDIYKTEEIERPKKTGTGTVKEKVKTLDISVQDILDQSLNHLKTLKEALCNSNYTYTKLEEEKACEYCDYKNICRYDLEKAEYHNPNKKEPELLNLDFINKNMFYFPEKTQKSSSGLTERQKQALATNKNILVTAGAGAGKTETLTERMKELLLVTKGNIEKILVITFTKKATAEMQNRIYKALIKDSSNPDNPNLEYIKKAKLNFKNNWISTIDSFYLRILQENALELGLDYNTNISEDVDIIKLKADTIEKTIDDLAFEKDPLINRILEAWNRKTLIEVLNKLVNCEWIDEYVASSFEEIASKYLDFYLKQAYSLLENLNKIESKIPRSENTSNPKLKTDLQKIESIIDFYRLNLESFISNKKTFTFEYELDKLKFPIKNDNNNIFHEEVKAELFATKTEKKSLTFEFLIQAGALNLELEQLKILLEIVKKVKSIYEKIKVERNIYTFSDISNNLYHLIKTNADIRKKLAAKFDFIMLDEFQDTNFSQYEIAKYLAGWDGQTLESINPNKLFFVGDEKQSIYKFRGGDVQVFNKAKEEISKINFLNGLKVEDTEDTIIFDDNFRSSENLVQFFNDFFKHVFKPYEDEKKIYEANHQDLKAHKKDGSVNFFLINKGEKSKKNLRKNLALEPKLIAYTVKKIFEYNPNEEIAILFRTSKKINRFANALEEAGVNYIIYGGSGFYQNQEILDIMSILKFIADKNRILELVGFLRSSFVGLSDKEINILKPNILKGLRLNHTKLYEKIFGVFEDTKLLKKGWKQLICDLKVYELVEVIIQDTFVKAPLFKAKSYTQKLKNLERFIEIAKEKTTFTLEEFIEFVDFKVENEINESNASILEVGEQKPVQLMTIHKSKGLGFDTVILADAGADSLKPHSEIIQLDDGEIFYKDEIIKNLIGTSIKDYSTDITSFTKGFILNHVKNKDEAELKRLLYVAMTRAKHNLIVSASCWNSLTSMSTIKNRGDIDNLVKIFNDYFIYNQDTSKKLKDFLVLKNNYMDINFSNIPFYIINADSDIVFEKKLVTLNNNNKSILANLIKIDNQEIYSYSRLKKNPEKIAEIISQNIEFRIKATPINGLKKINSASFFSSLEIKEKEKFMKDRGITIHKLLEYKSDSMDLINNLITNNIPPELVNDTLDHYNNIKLILKELSDEVIEEFEEIPFLNTNITGVFDKLVKTKNGWEIWDYKISEYSKESSIIEEIKKEYKLQFDVYYSQFSKLLNTNNIKYKLLFSNFGFIDLI